MPIRQTKFRWRKPPYHSKSYTKFQRDLAAKHLTDLWSEYLHNQSQRIGFMRRILTPKDQWPKMDIHREAQEAFDAENLPYNPHRKYPKVPNVPTRTIFDDIRDAHANGVIGRKTTREMLGFDAATTESALAGGDSPQLHGRGSDQTHPERDT